jgi:hypothetical protein
VILLHTLAQSRLTEDVLSFSLLHYGLADPTNAAGADEHKSFLGHMLCFTA